MPKCFHQPDAGFQLEQDHTTSYLQQNQGNHRKRGHCLGITKVMFCVEMHIEPILSQPTGERYTAIDKALLKEYPCLRDKGTFTG